MQPREIESYVDAAAAALHLPIAAEHRPGVLHHFALAADMAELVMAQALRPDDEPAPQFVPIAPGDTPPPARRRLR